MIDSRFTRKDKFKGLNISSDITIGNAPSLKRRYLKELTGKKYLLINNEEVQDIDTSDLLAELETLHPDLEESPENSDSENNPIAGEIIASLKKLSPDRAEQRTVNNNSPAIPIFSDLQELDQCRIVAHESAIPILKALPCDKISREVTRDCK